MKACEIYLDNEHFVIVCLHTTQVGGYVGGGPMTKLGKNVSAVALGESVLKTLRAKQLVYPVPIDIKAVTRALVEFAGYSSWRALYNSNNGTCVLEVKGGVLEITPFPYKNKGGFLPEQKKIVVCNLDAGVIGKAIFDLFGSVETITLS